MSTNTADGSPSYVGSPTASGEAKKEEEAQPRIRQPGRKIVVEPVLFLMALFGYPLLLLSQLFVVKKIREELAAEQGVNISDHVNQTGDSSCTTNKSDPAYIFNEEVQQRAAFFTIITAVVMGVPALFVTPFLGAYSDKVGRKYAILPPLFGTVIKAINFVLVIYFNGSIWWLMIGSFLEGCTGFYVTVLMGCFSYIADTTTPEQRMFRITVLEMCLFISAMLGPIGVGYVIQLMGFFWPFLVVLCGYIINILYVIFLVPETISRDPNAKFFSKDHVLKTFSLFTRDDGTNRRWKLIVLFFALFVSTLATLESGTSTLFELNTPLCWNATMIGYFTAAYIGVSTVGGLIFAKVFKRCLPDHYIALVAGLAAVVRMVYTGLVQNTIMMFFAPVMASFSILFIPTIRTLMSKLVQEGEQGAVFGAIALAEVMCTMFGSVVFNAIYSETVYFMTGFVFFAMALFYLVGSSFLVYFVVRLQAEEKSGKKYRLLSPEGGDDGGHTDDEDIGHREPTFENHT